MGVIFDLIGSFVVRAAIVMVLLNLMLSLNQALYKNNERVYLSEVIAGPAEVITNDFRLAGYNALTRFPIARVNNVSFYADTGMDGSSETIRYYLSSQTLYRTINGGAPFIVANSVSNFRLRYYNIYGQQLSYGTNINGIKSINIELTIWSPRLHTTIYSGSSDSTQLSATWENRVFPPNL